jgi:predicted flap endonuclease-1-like 5' DNA nuclease
MNTLFTQIAQTKTEAIIEIVFLLIVAGTIGYVTAMLYTKSVYRRKIRIISAAWDQATQQVEDLEAEMKEVTKKSDRKDTTIGEILDELSLVKESQMKARQEISGLTARNRKLEFLLQEKDDSFEHIAERKHFLSYGSFGTSTCAEKDDLKMISGISPRIEKCLNALDIFTFRQISRFTQKDIADINNLIEFISGRIEKDEWIIQAIELDQLKETRETILRQIKERQFKLSVDSTHTTDQSTIEDLTAISGIGGWIKEKLNALGIYNYGQISRFTDADIKTVTDAIQYFPGRIERDGWIQQARELAENAHWKHDLLQHLEQHNNEFAYNGLGSTYRRNANNLTLIDGIGLWLEERLNRIGIYTFSQISQITKDELNKISELLQIATDRIENENWIGQAIELEKRFRLRFSTNNS